MNSNNCVIQKISIIFFLLTLGIFLYICIFIWISSLKEDKNSLKMAMTSSPLNISNVITIMNCWAVLLKIKEVHLTRKQRLELLMICQAVNYYLVIKVYKFQAYFEYFSTSLFKVLLLKEIILVSKWPRPSSPLNIVTLFRIRCRSLEEAHSYTYFPFFSYKHKLLQLL